MLVYHVMDALVDGCFSVLAQLDDQIDGLEDEIPAAWGVLHGSGGTSAMKITIYGALWLGAGIRRIR